MSANKQDAGGLPEPVAYANKAQLIGVESADSSILGRNVLLSRSKTNKRTEPLYTANQMRAYGELCRAAPAGGDDLTETERRRAATFKIPQVGWACVSRQQSLPEPADCDWPMCGCDPYADKVIEALQESGVIRDHSAPAGSGEVGALVQKWRDESESGFDGDGNLSDTWTAQAKRACADELATLLRKLQQGAAPEELSGNGVKVESGFTGSGDGPVTPTVLISFAAGDFFSRDRFMRMIVAASQGQEGDHG